MTLYVGNLSYDVTESDLSTVFAEYGSVKQVKVPVDRDTGRMRGFAFVELDSETEEAAAIDSLDGAEWMGRTMKVNTARPRTERRPARNDSWGGGSSRYSSRSF